VTSKGGMQEVKYFWWISIIMLIRFDREWTNLAQ